MVFLYLAVYDGGMNPMKFIKLSAVMISATVMVGCGAIQTGEVGVRTTMTGQVKPEEMQQGFYTHFVSSVKQFSTKEITVPLMDMQPKAGDNLTLDDLDVEVYYTIDPNSVVDIHIKYANSHAKGMGVHYPAYELVRSLSREAIYETVSEYDSLVVHQQRDKIRNQVKDRTQRALDNTDPGVFKVHKVVIRNVKTDPAIEDSIKLAVARNKELEAKEIELNIARKQVEINEALTRSLTPEILEQKKLEVIENACQKGTCILSLDGTGATPVLNVR